MDINIKSTTPTITGVLTGVSSALIPQDIEVVPSAEETVLTADEGHYIRSVTVKAAITANETPSDTPSEPTDTPSSDVPSTETGGENSDGNNAD